MPYAPLSLCVVTGCPVMVASGRCAEHEAETRRDTDRRRPNGYQRGWSAEWSRFSKKYLAEHPQCESLRCTNLPTWQRPNSTDVDHVDGSGRTGARAYDTTNLQALCHSCHSSKTATHDGGFGRP
jgi:5-methylcytosine-specific restriction protein A